MTFVKKIMRPHFWKQEFYAKKRVNRNISQFATKERKCFKMAEFAPKEGKSHILRKSKCINHTFCVKAAHKFRQYV
jgi:hypothetical protein